MRISDWSSDVCSSDLFGLGDESIGAGAWIADAGAIGCNGDHDFHSLPKISTSIDVRVRTLKSPGERDLAFRMQLIVEAGIDRVHQIGRASCRERVCQNVSISLVAVSLKKKINNKLI